MIACQHYIAITTSSIDMQVIVIWSEWWTVINAMTTENEQVYTEKACPSSTCCTHSWPGPVKAFTGAARVQLKLIFFPYKLPPSCSLLLYTYIWLLRFLESSPRYRHGNDLVWNIMSLHRLCDTKLFPCTSFISWIDFFSIVWTSLGVTCSPRDPRFAGSNPELGGILSWGSRVWDLRLFK